MSHLANQGSAAAAFLLGIALVSPGARADVSAFSHTDPFEHTTTHEVTIKSDDYDAYTYENRWDFRCNPNGKISFAWHFGGQYSGKWEEGDVEYKIDDGEAQMITNTTMSRVTGIQGDFAPEWLDIKSDRQIAYVDFIRKLIRGNNVVARVGGVPNSWFNLTGAGKAFEPFEKQCMSPASALKPQ